jgi:hypothetical protein
VRKVRRHAVKELRCEHGLFSASFSLAILVGDTIKQFHLCLNGIDR